MAVDRASWRSVGLRAVRCPTVEALNHIQCIAQCHALAMNDEVTRLTSIGVRQEDFSVG